MTCTVEGCDTKHFGRGYCNKHYKRWRKYGDPLETKFERHPGDVCSVEGCDRDVAARGWCGTHWRRWRDTGDVQADVPIRPRPRGKKRGPCARPGCGRLSRGSGLCQRHYARLQMFRSYGVRDWDHFDRLWEKSKGRCGICDKRLEYDGKATHIDHDHVSGEARGVLCHHCNLGLGHFKDDPELLQKAAGYLRDNIFMR